MIKKINIALMFLVFTSFVFGGNFILKKDAKSVATGITICFKNKKFLEKKHSLPAVSDFVGHLFQVKEKKFDDKFKLLGAEVQFYDYPFIPFDDYYTNDYFGFVRIKVLPENTDRALILASQLIEEVKNFNNPDFVIATKSTFGSNIMRNKAKERAKEEIWKTYFPDGFVSLPDYNFSPKLSENDLREFLKEYLDTSNILVSIYGNFNEERVKSVLKDRFYSKNKTKIVNNLPVAKVKNHNKVINLNSKQAYVYLIYPVKDNLPVDEYAKLKLLTANASDKIAFQIREKEGLAYSIGCYLTYKGGHTFFVAYCGTNPEKANYVAKKISGMVKKLMLSPVVFEEENLTKIKNSIVFSDTLKTLPNVNKSFFNALYTLTGNFAYNKNVLDKAVKKARINRLCGRDYLDINNYLNIILK
ncbi:hypothetical protein TTHT_1580 [Thermotomaculum hydrothermale]|uniref:Peptidase M16 C-terminal domain-containing protein n=1 Tax=Thermotomaculum hydrothermale TaxID=981385 RepID=A0A7R6SYV8_9BACT|nr:insulinase family protein [Thermotomaculum hydrothermale]BBB33070.1 hypothetical protein TTHT_1580 [Thermotomaculum hydrothermale]